MFDFFRKKFQESRNDGEACRTGQDAFKQSCIGKFFDHSRTVGFFIMALVLATSVSIITLPENDSVGYDLVVGQTSYRTIYADFDFFVTDDAKTHTEQQKASLETPYFYVIQVDNNIKINQNIDEFITLVAAREKSLAEGKTFEPSPDNALGMAVGKLDKELLHFLSAVFADPALEDYFYQLTEQEINQGIMPLEIKENTPSTRNVSIIDIRGQKHPPTQINDIPAPEDAAKKIAILLLNEKSVDNKEELEQDLASVLVHLLGSGNLIYDEPYTLDQREKAVQEVKPVTISYLKGTPIIKKDTIVTADDVKKQKKYRQESNLRNDGQEPWINLTESILLCIILMVFTGIYIYYIHPEVAQSNRSIWMLGLIIIASLLLNRLFIGIFRLVGNSEQISPELIFLALPLALPAIVISTIYGMRVALYAGLFVSGVIAIAAGNSFQILITGLVVCGIAASAVRRANDYKSFFIRGFISVLITTLGIGLVFYWENYQERSFFEWLFILPLATGMLTAILAQSIIFLLEYFFDITTNMALLTFNDFNHPLLKRLQMEAPGTFHHSLMVATLAEQGAQEIGANSLKARVCALFHDIGKLTRPNYFTENNPHENMYQDLTPTESSHIIQDHVSDGVKLASKFQLKRVIRETIKRHHGTDLTYFFYRKAQDASPDGHVDEREFRYAGPLPEDRETVIIMLADCCEAAARSLEKPNQNKLDELTKDIFRKKIRDNQLDAANITFAELEKIREAFVKTLTTMYHGRIAYPKEKEKNEDDLFVAAGEKISAAESKSNKKSV